MGAATEPQDEGASSYSGKVFRKKGGSNPMAMLPPEEARVRAIAEVVNSLIQAVQEGRDVDLNELKTKVRIAKSID